MELNYYRLIFTNGQEYVVSSEIADTHKFKSALTGSGIFSPDKHYINMQLTETTEPLGIKYDKLFSVQKLNSAVIGNQTRLWKLL